MQPYMTKKTYTFAYMGSQINVYIIPIKSACNNGNDNSSRIRASIMQNYTYTVTRLQFIHALSVHMDHPHEYLTSPLLYLHYVF